MRQLANQMRLEAQRVASRIAHPRAGKVTSYDPVHYAAVVELQPDGELTGWLPISSPWVGASWGLFCPPTPGDVVDVYFQEGDIESGWIEGRQFLTPLPCPSGEFWIVHKSSSSLKFTNDGKVSLITASDLDITVGGATNITSTETVTVTAPTLAVVGNITATGDITDQVNGTAESMRSQRQIFDEHVHPGIQPGSGSTGTPTQTE